MSNAIETLKKAQELAFRIRPKVGGFPYLAEAFRLFGITRNVWTLPSCQSVFYMKEGNVVSQGAPLFTGDAEIPRFDQKALVQAIRRDQAGESTFPEFLKSTWMAGIIRYDVDFGKRTVTYFGALDESYVEEYPKVEVKV